MMKVWIVVSANDTIEAVCASEEIAVRFKYELGDSLNRIQEFDLIDGIIEIERDLND